MEVLPDDDEARRESLERWGAQQERQVLRAQRRQIFRRLAQVQWRAKPGDFLDASERLLGRFLDRGLDTSDSASGPEHIHPDREIYVPSPWYVLPRALRYLGVSDHDTFVDFGCGKGRVVHQAARRPFRRVIGVEIS